MVPVEAEYVLVWCSIPFNLICNMTTFRFFWPFDPTLKAENVCKDRICPLI